MLATAGEKRAVTAFTQRILEERGLGRDAPASGWAGCSRESRAKCNRSSVFRYVPTVLQNGGAQD